MRHLTLRDRLGRADALHTRETTFPHANQACCCQQWEVRVPYNATSASIAHEQHRLDALTAVVAAWLHEEAAALRKQADGWQTTLAVQNFTAKAAAVKALADSISPEVTP